MKQLLDSKYSKELIKKINVNLIQSKLEVSQIYAKFIVLTFVQLIT